MRTLHLILSTILLFGTVNISRAQYCPASGPACDDAFNWIINFEFGSLVSNSECADGFGSEPAYSDFTDMSVQIEAGETYDVVVNLGGSTWPANTATLFIDWNGDGVFGDATSGETNNVPGADLSFSGTITAPASFEKEEPTRMRIRVVDASVDDPNSSCGVSTYGEVEDYTALLGSASGTSAPDAMDDHDTTVTDSTISIFVLGNDTDADEDLDSTSLAVVSDTTVQGGIVMVDTTDTGYVSYTPPSGFHGEDTFLYTVCDMTPECDTAAVFVHVDSGATKPDTTVDTNYVASLLSSEINIYPNPAKAVVNIEVGNRDISSVRLIGLSGREIKNVEIISDKINIADLSPGIYLIEVIADGLRGFTHLSVSN